MPDLNKLCKACEHYDAKPQECHRYAPKPVLMDEQKKIRWPSTPPIGWCGEFKAKEQYTLLGDKYCRSGNGLHIENS